MAWAFITGLAVAATTPISQDVDQSAKQEIYNEGGVRIDYSFVGSGVQFTSVLPERWTFSVNVDGDQNGIWGVGPVDEARTAQSSEDFAYGLDVDSGTLCSQYILAANVNDSSSHSVSSACDSHVSAAYLQVGQIDRSKNVKVSLYIPGKELFGSRSDAHLQVCVWDTRAWRCKYSPMAPFVLAKVGPG